jgi:hypothetical protein
MHFGHTQRENQQLITNFKSVPHSHYRRPTQDLFLSFTCTWTISSSAYTDGDSDTAVGHTEGNGGEDVLVRPLVSFYNSNRNMRILG